MSHALSTVLARPTIQYEIRCSFIPYCLIYITISNFTSIRPSWISGVCHVCPVPSHSVPSQLQFPQSDHKMSLIKVTWNVLNIHSWSPTDLQGQYSKAKQINVLYIIRQCKANLHILKLTPVFHCLPSVDPKQLCALAHLGCTGAAVTS